MTRRFVSYAAIVLAIAVGARWIVARAVHAQSQEINRTIANGQGVGSQRPTVVPPQLPTKPLTNDGTTDYDRPNRPESQPVPPPLDVVKPEVTPPPLNESTRLTSKPNPAQFDESAIPPIPDPIPSGSILPDNDASLIGLEQESSDPEFREPDPFAENNLPSLSSESGLPVAFPHPSNLSVIPPSYPENNLETFTDPVVEGDTTTGSAEPSPTIFPDEPGFPTIPSDQLSENRADPFPPIGDEPTINQFDTADQYSTNPVMEAPATELPRPEFDPGMGVLPQVPSLENNPAYASQQEPQQPAPGNLPEIDPSPPNITQQPFRGASSDTQVIQATQLEQEAGDPVSGNTGPRLIPPDATQADRLVRGPRLAQLEVRVIADQSANVKLSQDVLITVENQGPDDAYNVFVLYVRDPHVQFEGADPQPVGHQGQILTWDIGTLRSGELREIKLDIRPLEPKPIQHVAWCQIRLAAKSITDVMQPKLEIEIFAPPGKVYQGQVVDLEVQVRNIGSGPARNIKLFATLSSGLQAFVDEGQLSDSKSFDTEIPDLEPNQTYTAGALPIFAEATGAQICTIEAVTPDIPKEDAQPQEIEILVVAPELVVEIVGPKNKAVGSVADYTITVSNKGDADATNVLLGVFPPKTGVPDLPDRAISKPNPSQPFHRIYWKLDRIEPRDSVVFQLPIRLDEIEPYRIKAAVTADGPPGDPQGVTYLEPSESYIVTDVTGIGDIDIFNFDRSDPVVEIGDKVDVEFTIENIGSAVATNISVDFLVPNEFEYVTSRPKAERNNAGDNGNGVGYRFVDAIERLLPGAKDDFTVTLRSVQAGTADFDVEVTWDGQTDFDGFISKGVRVKVIPQNTNN